MTLVSPAVRTTCAYCGVGCGMQVAAREDGTFSVTGDFEHPANYGRLCAKGAALAETIGVEDRLLYPRIDGQRASWEQALDTIADKFAQAIAIHGPDAVAFYVSGQLLTEDYYVANKLMKGFIGSANIDTNSRLCMASSVAGHKRAFGEDVVPGVYTDLELADVVVLVGSNLAWCHPVLHQRLLAARDVRNTRIVVIDPRATATSADADLHLALTPGTDVALFNGLLRHIIVSGTLDESYIADHTKNFAAAQAEAMRYDIERVVAVTGLARAHVQQFYELFARHSASMTVYSQGVNQSRVGTDKVNAIINCHLATGRVGKPGSGPFSITGQPNAMGGRETGGLANMLAAHLDIENAEHRKVVAEFWQADRLANAPGLKAVDLFDAVAQGKIKALWIMATNPAVSMPDAEKVRAAIAGCPFVVVSDITQNADTAALAQVLLPAAGWGEKDGTVTNSERRISRQRAFTKAPGEARPDWWALTEVARRMGFAHAFNYSHPADIYREFAALTGLARRRGRKLDLYSDAAIDRHHYDVMAPRTWPFKAYGDRERRLFGDGVFATADGRANFIATVFHALPIETGQGRALVLNTGRSRDQWHTMTRSGRAARLCSHTAEPHVEMHPATARKHGLKPADLAVIALAGRHIVARVVLTERQSPDAIFVPMHWSAQTASCARVNTIVATVTDPISGQPELKASMVSLSRYHARWYAFAIFEDKPEIPPSGYWALMRARAGWRLEFAGTAQLGDVHELLGALSPPALCGSELLDYHDCQRDAYRVLALRDSRLTAALYIAREPVGVQRNWAADMLGATLAREDYQAVLAGYPRTSGDASYGDIVCACHQVASGAIIACIRAGKVSLGEVGRATAAGTNCGSCRIEIQTMINQEAVAVAV